MCFLAGQIFQLLTAAVEFFKHIDIIAVHSIETVALGQAVMGSSSFSYRTFESRIVRVD